MAKRATVGGGTIQVRQFNGGMAVDPRDPTPNRFLFSTNFDCLTNPFKLIPYLDTESGDTNASTDKIQNFCIALRTGTTYELYGLGVVSGTGQAEVYYRDIPGTNDTTTTWGTLANNTSSAGATDFRLFVYYKSTGLIYGARAGSDIWAYDPTAATAWADSSQAVSYTNVCQGLVHSMNDVLYVGFDNNVASKNGSGGWNLTNLVLPSDLYITDLAEFGNYLAILATPLSGIGDSKVFLWDMSATTWNLEIDNGEGVGKVIHTVSGALITISQITDNALEISRLVVRQYTARGMVPLYMFKGGSGDILTSHKQLSDNRLLFSMTLTVDGAIRAGVWSVSIIGKTFAVVQELNVNNDTAMAAGDTLGGFIKVQGFTFQSYTSSSTWAMSKSDPQSYTATSVYETTINPEMPPGYKIQTKQLIAIGAMYDSFQSGGQVIVQYKVDGGAWTTVFTETTANAVFTEPVTSLAGGTTQFTDGKEYSFKVESTGGVEVTGLMYKYGIIPTTL